MDEPTKDVLLAIITAVSTAITGFLAYLKLKERRKK